MRPPRELRDTFDLLGRLGPDQSLDQVLDRLHWQDITPQQVCYAVLGRMPQDMPGPAPDTFDARRYFRSLLLSSEFQSAVVPALLNAFPEKPRRFFVHVPRSGGTSLGETLGRHACRIAWNALGPDWDGGLSFLDEIGRIRRGIAAHETIHLTGHYTLRSLVDQRLIRFGDSVSTSLRAPRQVIVSYMNYILTTLHADPDLLRPDSRHWAARLGLRAPVRLHPERMHRLLPRLVADDKLLPRDLLCHFLGDGTTASAIGLLAAADVEIIDSTKLDQWRAQRWNAAALPWANVSRGFFRWEALDDRVRRRIDRLIGQDLALHRAVAPLFDGAVSLRGGLHGVRPAGDATGIGGPGRTGRAARPILLDPRFVRVGADGGQLGWADPPLAYRTIETTLRLPGMDTRIRIRYARRPSQPRPRSWRRALLRAIGGLAGRKPLPSG